MSSIQRNLVASVIVLLLPMFTSYAKQSSRKDTGDPQLLWDDTGMLKREIYRMFQKRPDVSVLDRPPELEGKTPLFWMFDKTSDEPISIRCEKTVFFPIEINGEHSASISIGDCTNRRDIVERSLLLAAQRVDNALEQLQELNRQQDRNPESIANYDRMIRDIYEITDRPGVKFHQLYLYFGKFHVPGWSTVARVSNGNRIYVLQLDGIPCLPPRSSNQRWSCDDETRDTAQDTKRGMRDFFTQLLDQQGVVE